MESCSTYQDEISTFGPYTLTQTTTDQDWDCINELAGFESDTGEGLIDGVTEAVVATTASIQIG